MPDRVHTDDDLDRIHSKWLGPPGYTLPFAIPMRGILPGALAFLVGLPLLRALGLRGLVLYGAAVVFTYLISMLVIRVTGPERPVSALGAIVVHEISGPRLSPPPARSAVFRPSDIPVSELPEPGSRSPGHRHPTRSEEGTP